MKISSNTFRPTHPYMRCCTASRHSARARASRCAVLVAREPHWTKNRLEFYRALFHNYIYLKTPKERFYYVVVLYAAQWKLYLFICVSASATSTETINWNNWTKTVHTAQLWVMCCAGGNAAPVIYDLVLIQLIRTRN